MKPIFQGNDDFNKSAFLNWTTSPYNHIENFAFLADGFFKSGISLTKMSLKDNADKKADILIFPIQHNINHGIELYLKAIILTLNELIEIKRFSGGHDIRSLLSTLYARLREYGNGELRYFKQILQNLELYIIELYNLTGGRMDYSRYTFDSQSVNHFYIDDLKNIVIDLENFIEVFQQIHQSLEERLSYYLILLDQKKTPKV